MTVAEEIPSDLALFAVCPECGRIPKRIIAGRCGACYEARRHGRGFRKWPELDPEIAAVLFQVPGTNHRFARRVFSFIDPSGDCWEWTGTKGPEDYGVINRGARDAGEMPAHRAVWELLVGPIPEEMSYDHLCKNHSCVNPDHGEIVTPAENTMRSWTYKMYKAREVCEFGHPLDGMRLSGKRRGQRHCKTCNRERMRVGRVPRDPGACKKGHKWTPESTYISPGNGRRTCKICMADRQRARSAARRRANQIGQLDEAA